MSRRPVRCITIQSSINNVKNVICSQVRVCVKYLILFLIQKWWNRLILIQR